MNIYAINICTDTKNTDRYDQVAVNKFPIIVIGTHEELVKYLMSEFENNPQSIWETNMFGKSLHMLVNEGINTKVNAMPVEAQRKIRKTLGKIVNEGKGGIICILL